MTRGPRASLQFRQTQQALTGWWALAATVLWLPIQALTFLVRSGTQQLAESPLCETGLLLLLALLHHAPVAGHENPFQQALYALQVGLHSWPFWVRQPRVGRVCPGDTAGFAGQRGQRRRGRR